MDWLDLADALEHDLVIEPRPIGAESRPCYNAAVHVLDGKPAGPCLWPVGVVSTLGFMRCPGEDHEHLSPSDDVEPFFIEVDGRRVCLKDGAPLSHPRDSISFVLVGQQWLLERQSL